MFIAILILIFIRPFIACIAYPYADSVYSAVLAACLIIFSGDQEPDFGRMKPVLHPLGLCMAGVVISTLFSRDRLTSFLELYKFIPYILVFAVASRMETAQKRTVIFTMLGASLAISVLALHQYAIGFNRLAGFMDARNIINALGSSYIGAKRVFFPFVTPNALSGYLAMIIPLTQIEKRYRWSFVPLVAALLLTKSMGGVLALSAAVYVSFMVFTKFKPEKILILICLLAVIAVIFIWRISVTGIDGDPLFSSAMRLNYWRDTLDVIRRSPLVGTGLGTLNIPHSLFAHNSYLQIWAECGIIALIGFLWLCCRVIVAAAQAHNASPLQRPEIPFIVCSLLAFLFHNAIDFTYYLPEISLLWWALLGLAL